MNGDLDLHDLKVTDKGTFYVSSLFNCVCQPSTDHRSFNVYWVPPWITKNALGNIAKEDRCHLNGLCCDETGLPRYVTSACRSDAAAGWREKSQQHRGVVFDVVNNVPVVEGMCHPHSPKLAHGKLWVLESGTGQFGYVDLENKKFVPMKFLPGFLRGMDFFGNYVVICSSLDRHDTSFEHIPLGEILKSKELEARCALYVLNVQTMEEVGALRFSSGFSEFYDVVALPTPSPAFVDISNEILSTNFRV
jgi:uncharacterized protein (TIGR03032 family)